MNYTALKTELTTGHPDQGAYNADNQLAADQLNAEGAYTSWARPAPADFTGMHEYLVKNRSRTNDGGDTVSTSLLGRLKTIAESAVGDSVFGRTGANDTVTNETKHAAQMFMSLVANTSRPSIDLTITEIDAAFVALGPPGSGGIGVWKDPDITALKNLSQGQQSRAQEISTVIDYNGRITSSHVAHARSI